MGLAAIVGKTLAYPTIGILPEQEFLSDQLNRWREWYDPNKATKVGAVTQSIAGFALGVLELNPVGFFGGTILAVEGIMRYDFLGIANEPHTDREYHGEDEDRRRYIEFRNEKSRMFVDRYARRGSYFLEVPWSVLKRTSRYVGRGINNLYDRLNKDDRPIVVGRD